jgi:hypothetical protein
MTGQSRAGQPRRPKPLRPYIVTLASGIKYRFLAEDRQHAREQAEDAEPDDAVLTVEREG